MYTLIILSWFTGYVSGYQVTSIELGSKATCEAAAAELLKQNDGNTIKAFCVLRTD